MGSQQPQTSTKPTLQHNNVAGGRLSLFSKKPIVGIYKDGYCRSGDDDQGNHSIATTLTQPFLSSQYGSEAKSAGLKDGDRTCLSAQSFADAIKAADEGKLEKNAVPKVHLHATHDKALKAVGYKDLKRFAAPPEAAKEGGRQEAAHDPNNSGSIAGHSQSIGGDQPTVAPGMGKNHNKAGQQSSTSGQRG